MALSIEFSVDEIQNPCFLYFSEAGQMVGDLIKFAAIDGRSYPGEKEAPTRRDTHLLPPFLQSLVTAYRGPCGSRSVERQVDEHSCEGRAYLGVDHAIARCVWSRDCCG